MNILFFLLLSSLTFADCNVFIPKKEFRYQGYTLRFDFTKLLVEKNYFEVDSLEGADFTINFQGTTNEEGRFHKAIATMEMGPYKVEDTATCFTQFCAMKDFAKVFNGTYKKLMKSIPKCEG